MSPEGKKEKSEADGKSPDEIREEIEETRKELGETVAAVAEKTDVKKQAQAKVDDVKAQATSKAEEAKAKAASNPVPLAIAGGVLLLFVLWRVTRR